MGDHPHERRGEIGGVRRPGSDKARWKHWLWKVDWVWRRLVPLTAIVMACWALIGMDDRVTRTEAQLEVQRQGRQVAIEVLCGGLSGVSEAGRLILIGELPPPAPSLPPMSDRERRSRELYAQAYAIVISRQILEQAGVVNANEVLSSDGTVDCQQLKKASTSPPTRSPTATP